MNFKIISQISVTLFVLFSMSTHATELDNYLVQKNLIDQNYKIKDKKNLNDVLTALSEEDSRVLPVQIDQNTLIEKIDLFHDHIDLQGIITSADFNQFANSVGKEQIQSLLIKSMIENCDLIFENEFQRKNPYYVKMKLVSDHKSYELKINNNQCKF
ncbi:hypothetical protein [Acinetobacter piscicola]|uniref:hypothetical protein n=1 Tax=Acinetobacter piscicola TaxID=2006115 RepID=UPI000B800DFD|nr:hypothetical protein [Acinetobacter piscicola]